MATATAAPCFSSCVPALSKETLSVIEGTLGFDRMTPVQAATIPLFLTNKDVCVEAVTGSGKTLSYVIPIVEMLLRREKGLKKRQVGAIVIVPTRELAAQVFGIMEKFSAAMIDGSSKPALLVGGTSVTDVLNDLSKGGSHVLIGTPGRMRDILCNHDVVDVKELEVLVLDEADTLLDMGFRDAVGDIFTRLPKQRRTGLFSATQTTQVADLARAGLRNPATVSVAVRGTRSGSEEDSSAGNRGGGSVVSTPAELRNFYCLCPQQLRLPGLVSFLSRECGAERGGKVIVFVATCASVDYWGAVLPQLKLMQGVQVRAFHGRMVQKKRTSVHAEFMGMPSGVLICTDVAARGLDFPDVKWIVQFDPPKDPNFFVHRVGRTARAGRSGQSLTFLLPEEDPYIEFLAARKVRLEEMKIESLNLPVDEDNQLSKAEADHHDHGREIRRLVRTDRALLEKGSHAFVSFVRAYKEHQCQFIFRFAALDLGALANTFSLIRLPRIPELKGKEDGIILAGASEVIDTTAIPYADKHREKARQKRLEVQAAEKAQKVADLANPKLQRQLEKKRAAEQKAINETIRMKKNVKKKKHLSVQAEWNELAEDERLFKRLKKGKITDDEYEEQLFSTRKDAEDVAGGSEVNNNRRKKKQKASRGRYIAGRAGKGHKK